MAEGVLIFFEVFKTYSFNVEGAIAPDSHNYGHAHGRQEQRHSFLPKWAFPEGRDKGTPNVVTETYVRSKIL